MNKLIGAILPALMIVFGCMFAFNTLQDWGFKPKICTSPFPTHLHQPGDIVTHTRTGEQVRVMYKYFSFESEGSCMSKMHGDYEIRFNDGAIARVNWLYLQPLSDR